MIQGVLFDMDGLMFDTERLSIESWKRVAAARDIEVPPDELFIRMTGINRAASERILKDYYGEDFDAAGIEEAMGEELMRTISASGMPLKPGLRELLSALRSRGIRMALATSTARARAARYLHIAGVQEFFDEFATGDEIKNSKPAPDIFIAAAKRLGVPADKALVLEDSTNGVLAAHAAGIRCICVPDLVTPPQEVLATAAAVLPSLREVIDWIDTDNGKETDGREHSASV